MALTFQGVSYADINDGKITSIEVRQQGIGSFINVGMFDAATCEIAPIIEKGENNASVVEAVAFSLTFTGKQTDLNQELANFNDNAGAGLFNTDVEVRVTFATGLKILLGSVSPSPFRLVPLYNSGGTDAQNIKYVGENIEGVATVAAKLS